jgi:hypothetical protein
VHTHTHTKTYTHIHKAALRSSVPESHKWHLLEHAGRFTRSAQHTTTRRQSARTPRCTLPPQHVFAHGKEAQERRDQIWLDSSLRGV